jgi:hypothetical protein
MSAVVLIRGRKEVVFPLPAQILLAAASGSPRLCVNATANWIPNAAARTHPRTHPRTQPRARRGTKKMY